jgi:hypothetical protein
MPDEQLKPTLHSLIENCEDETILEALYKILQATQKPEEKDWWQELNPEDKLRLEESVIQYEKGQFKSHEQVMQNAKKWLKK